jgi:hypothetical protein
MEYLTIVYVSCNGHDHRIGIDKRLRFHPLDHDAAMVEAFTAFGATEPDCLRTFRNEWEDALHELSGSRFGQYSELSAEVHEALSWLGHGVLPHQTVTNAMERWVETAMKKRTNKEEFGRWLIGYQDIEPPEFFRLAAHAGPHSRALMAFFDDLDIDQRVQLMKGPGIPAVPAGVFALVADSVSRKDRLAIAWKATPKLRGWISNSKHNLRPQDRVALAKSAPSDQQCWVARLGGPWLSSRQRLEFAKECDSEAIVLDTIIKEQLLLPVDTFRLGMHWLRGGGRPWRPTSQYEAGYKLMLMGKANLTPGQRLRLLEAVGDPAYRGAVAIPMRETIACRMYRRRRQFGFTPEQIRKLEKFKGRMAC